MPARKGNIFLRVLLIVLLLIVVGGGGIAIWLSRHYKTVIKDHLPQMVSDGTDGIYKFTCADVAIDFSKRMITFTGIRLWPDTARIRLLQEQNMKIPSALFTISIPRLEAEGLAWGEIPGSRAMAFRQVRAYDVNWQLVCTPRQGGTKREKEDPFIRKISSGSVLLINPHLTYAYYSPKKNFKYYLNGGNISLQQCIYNFDEQQDTSLFLFARGGTLRPDSFILSNSKGRYISQKPLLDFTAGPEMVALRNVALREMVLYDPLTGNKKEIQNISLPLIELHDFNWNMLVSSNKLRLTKMVATDAAISIRNFDKYADKGSSKMGSYPNQKLLDVAMNTNIDKLEVRNATYTYTIVLEKGDEAPVKFTGINGSFTNVTNIPSIIAARKFCQVRLAGKYMGENEVAANIRLYLADKSGRYTVDGYIKDLDGKDVSQQARAFTLVKVTHFHLNRMDMHITGDETYSKGSFTILYDGLKISMLKFDTKMREGKKGPFAFLGTLVLYPSNPMRGKDVRTVTTSFGRDTTKGFVNQIWINMFRAAKKTAVRNQDILNITDGRETSKGEHPKEGFFKKLFGKKR